MKRLVTAALVVSLMTGTVAMANPQDNRDHGYGDRHDSHERHDDHGRDHDRRDDHRYEEHGRYHVGDYHHPRGYRFHEWQRGERLPSAYRQRVYVVNDYHTYRLREPPRGYHWVRVDNNVVLAAVATGVVLEVVSNLFY
jgi:Ni/Co efflux regulator RcnB